MVRLGLRRGPSLRTTLCRRRELVESINLENSLWGVTDFNSLPDLTPHFEEAAIQLTWDK